MDRQLNELFLLISNISQMGNPELVIKIFTEAINSFNPNVAIKYSESADSSVEQLEICTNKNIFGYYSIYGNPAEISKEFPIYFQNSVQMLALILERLKNENMLTEKNEIFRRDLEYAKSIQMSMIPKAKVCFGPIAINSRYIPSERLSGDLYDYFQIDNKIYGFLSDVSGHGVRASMLTMFIYQCIKSYLDFNNLTPGKMLEFIYQQFNKTNLDDDIYIVLFFFMIDLDKRLFIYSSAGLNTHPIHIDKKGRVEKMDISGFPICKLGNLYSGKYFDTTIKLQNREKFFFYTDGLVEGLCARVADASDDVIVDLIKSLPLDTKNVYKQLDQKISQKLRKDINDDITYLMLEIT